MSAVKSGRFVIIGASLAGGSAAAALREDGFEGDVTMIGAETRLPYSRPPLSKGYLRGEDRFEDQLVNPAAFSPSAVNLRLGVRATAIDAGSKNVTLEGGENVPYDRLLVTTGGRNRTLSTPGGDLPGIFQLRTVEDCDRIRAGPDWAPRGGGGAGLHRLGGDGVSPPDGRGGDSRRRTPGAAGPGARTGGRRGARRHPSRERCGAGARGFHRRLRGRGPREAGAHEEGPRAPVRLRGGRHRHPAQTELLAAAGAKVDNGVLVDEHCRTTLSDVYAAGDVANHLHPLFGRLRVEHWNNGFQQGRAAARAMLGGTAPYDYLHTFWSDQYEHTIEYVGFAAEWDRLVFRGEPASRKFLGFYLKDGIVRAVVGLDRGGDPEDPKNESELRAAAGLIRDRVRVDPARLVEDHPH